MADNILGSKMGGNQGLTSPHLGWQIYLKWAWIMWEIWYIATRLDIATMYFSNQQPIYFDRVSIGKTFLKYVIMRLSAFLCSFLISLYFLTSLTGWGFSAKDSDIPGWTHPFQLHRPSMTSWTSTSPPLSGCTFSHISASYVSQLRNNIIKALKRTNGKICMGAGFSQNVPWHSLMSNVPSNWGINP